MVSKAKLYSKLDALEAELLERLVPHLQSAAERNDDSIFHVKAFSTFTMLKHKTDPLTEELVKLGSQILSLRAKLGEPCEGIIAERICWYCRKLVNTQSHQRLGGTRLAKQFLGEIENE